jgi:hypothetical protein
MASASLNYVVMGEIMMEVSVTFGGAGETLTDRD